MLTFKNFEEEIPENILEKGMDYCDANRVQKLTESSPGNWNTVVNGSSKFQVSIILAGENISSWNCSCHKLHGDICEHVAAVIYDLYDYLDFDDDFDEDDDDDE